MLLTPKAEFPAKLEPLFQPSRYKVLYGGRGGAKSWGVARALLMRGVTSPQRYLCAREVQNSIADSVHKLLSDQIVNLGLEPFYRVQQNAIYGANGTEFSFRGLRHQTLTSLKSHEGVDVCWVEEAVDVSKRSWEIIVPTIRKNGSEIWITFNPELDTDETYQRFVVEPPEDAIVIAMGWRDNPWFPATLEKERIALSKRDPDAYENVWEGKCRPAVEGAIYSREIAAMHAAGRLREVPHDPALKVHTIWDLGWNDKNAIILAQRAASELRVIGYLEDEFRTLGEYVADLRALPYNWGTDWLPHDGAARNLQTGKSSQEALEKLGRNVQIVPKLDVEEGIKAARLVFPRVYFDRSAMSLVNHLKRYRRQVNAATQTPGIPLHDDASHGADAFRYLAIVAEYLDNDESAPIDMSRLERMVV